MKDNVDNIEILENDYGLSAIEDIRKHRVAAMLLSGYSNQEIAELTKLSIRQVTEWQRDKAFKNVLRIASEKVFNVSMVKLCLNAEKAVDAVVAILDNPDASDRNKLQAASLILDTAAKVKQNNLENRLEALEAVVNDN